MGCDIHIVLEQRAEDDRWIGIDTYVGHEGAYVKGWSAPIARERNYLRFAALAGVRGDGPEPKGMPMDASETTRFLADEYGGDGHSHSLLSIKDAERIFSETYNWAASSRDDFGKKYPGAHFFGVDYSEGSSRSADDYRIVFWFDN